MPEPTKTLTPDESYNILISQVHAPVFFNKLASVYGINPQSPEEARELLLIASRLRNAHEHNKTKQANAKANFFSEARKDLDATLNQSGVPSLVEDSSVKAAAAEAAKNPLISEAAVVFANYMAQV